MSAPLDVSVIVPTRDRVDSLLRTVRAVERQALGSLSAELIVVADGCRDDTVARVRSRQSSIPVRVVLGEGRGAAAARNAGAALAAGQCLVFLDDDVEPARATIARHASLQRAEARCVGMGPYRPSLVGRSSLFRMQARAWWHDKFDEIAAPGRRFEYRDLLTGNLSIRAALFDELGGFDETIGSAGGEDYELGVRLIRAGARFRLLERAVALHHEHETMSLECSLRRAHQEGLADVAIARRHPELRHPLFAELEDTGDRSMRIVRRGVFERPQLGRQLARAAERLLGPLEALRMRQRWRRVYGALFAYHYWAGVADAFGSLGAVSRLLAEVPETPHGPRIVELDLTHGFDDAARQLDAERPDGAVIRIGSDHAGRIDPRPGAEPLRGAHLRPWLVRHCAWPLARSLALASTTLDEGLARSLPGTDRWRS